MSPFGGPQPGSGPKPILQDGANYTVRLGTTHLALLDRYAAAHELPNRSAAIRQLIETSAADSQPQKEHQS